jgi:hypothetical protein
MSEIRINAPGAGKWVMGKLASYYSDHDQAFTVHEGDEIRGGIVLSKYAGASAMLHAYSCRAGYCSRELLWMVFDYGFNQLGCRKLLLTVRSDNYRALSIYLRAGWVLEASIADAFAKGVHMLILTITKDTCPWLNYTPRKWRSGGSDVRT